MAGKITKTAEIAANAVSGAAAATNIAVKNAAKTSVAVVAKAAAPVVQPVEARTAPVAAAVATPARRAAKIVKVKATPVRKAIVKAAKPIAAPKPIITKAANAVVTAARTVATLPSKEPTIMATMFEAPKMFTDMNDRTKTAVEKTQKFAAEFGDFNKGNIEAMVESSKIAAKGLESMGQEAADYTRKSFEGMTATLKSLAAVKSPTDFFKLQSDYARSAFDAAVAQGSKNTEAMIKLASDAAQPISSRFAVAVEKVKLAA